MADLAHGAASRENIGSRPSIVQYSTPVQVQEATGPHGLAVGDQPAALGDRHLHVSRLPRQREAPAAPTIHPVARVVAWLQPRSSARLRGTYAAAEAGAGEAEPGKVAPAATIA